MPTTQQHIQRTVDNNPTDYLKVFGFAKEWLKTRTGKFTAEDLKKDYLKVNQPPRQVNVYGTVFYALSKDNLAIEVGTTKATTKQSHGRLLRVWQPVVPGQQIAMFS